MWQWLVVIVSGICTLASFYLTSLAFRSGDRGVFLFAGFGLLFGIPFVVSAIKVFSRRSAVLKKMDEKISGKPKPVSFVPHWFMVSALTIVGIVILGVIIISFFSP